MFSTSRKQYETNKLSTMSSKRDFNVIMAEATREMPWYSRVFSKFIHSISASSLSSIIGKTVARPNAILFGAIFSFALTLSAYLISKNLGYRLSGFESIGAFLIGWGTGILFDILSPLFKKKR